MSQTLSVSANSRPRRRRARVSRPARHSLNDILHRHAGTSLFVRPVCWTDAHTRLLGAQFVELPACDTPRPDNVTGSPPSRGHLQPSKAIMTLSHTLTEILMPDVRHAVFSSTAVKTTLSTLWPAAFNCAQIFTELPMFFGDRVYRDAVRTQVTWSFPNDGLQSSESSFTTISTRSIPSCGPDLPSPTEFSANLPPPMMCYIGKNQLASMRRNLFRIPFSPERSWNEPVLRLQQLRSKSLVPADSDRDAHLVAIFVAMAQRHFYDPPFPSPRRDTRWPSAGGKPQRPPFKDIKLRILTHDNETADFLVYTAYVTAKFLDRFHDPACAPQSDGGRGPPGLRIEFTRVPIWPILGLRERLGKALGEDVVGPFDISEMETWEDAEADSSHCKDTKRRREALTEVFNSSFEENPDGEEPYSPLSAKRRRLAEGSPVSAVA